MLAGQPFVAEAALADFRDFLSSSSSLAVAMLCTAEGASRDNACLTRLIDNTATAAGKTHRQPLFTAVHGVSLRTSLGSARDEGKPKRRRNWRDCH
jgi:hypothetical protein